MNDFPRQQVSALVSASTYASVLGGASFLCPSSEIVFMIVLMVWTTEIDATTCQPRPPLWLFRPRIMVEARVPVVT